MPGEDEHPGLGRVAQIGDRLKARLAEQFPAEVRTTGIGLPYALAVAVFGGVLLGISLFLSWYSLGNQYAHLNSCRGPNSSRWRPCMAP